jgi:fatty acid desaturase
MSSAAILQRDGTRTTDDVESHEPRFRRARAEDLRAAVTALATPRAPRYLLAVAGEWLIIVLVMILARRLHHVAAYAAAIFLLGARQHGLAILGHDGAHRLGTRSRWLNDVVAQVFCFWPLGVDMHTYRGLHFAHHRHTNTARDPELAYRSLGPGEWDLPRSPRGVALRFAGDLVGLGAREVLRLMSWTRPPRLTRYLGVASLAAAALIVTASTGTLWALVLWYVALFTSFAAIYRLGRWLEHLGTDGTHRVRMPRWLSWLIAPHNVYHHWEHHEWPAIPSWNLPRARLLDTSEPLLGVGEVLQHFARSRPIKTGAPTLDEDGRSLIGAS